MQTSTSGFHRLLSHRSVHPVRASAAVLAMAAVLAIAQEPSRNPNKPIINPAANPVPDKNEQMRMQMAQALNNGPSTAAATERQKQLVDDAARLLQLATELKKEVDKTDKDTLSINVIRKAEMIEKLAKGVKAKMKVAGGAS